MGNWRGCRFAPKGASSPVSGLALSFLLHEIFRCHHGLVLIPPLPPFPSCPHSAVLRDTTHSQKGETKEGIMCVSYLRRGICNGGDQITALYYRQDWMGYLLAQNYYTLVESIFGTLEMERI